MSSPFMLNAVRDQLSTLARLRSASAEYTAAFDAYLKRLAAGEAPEWAEWNRLEDAHRGLVVLMGQFQSNTAEVEREAYSETMAKRARARYEKGSGR